MAGRRGAWGREENKTLAVRLILVAIFVATRTVFVRVSGGYRAEIELQKPLFYKG